MQFKGNSDQSSSRYWDDLAELYQKETRISTDDFHYGPLLPGDSTMKLLPDKLCRPGAPTRRFQCLELGCGAGQNSIFLAKQGARCVAIDISEKQLEHGRKLAAAEQVEVVFHRISMDSLRGVFVDAVSSPRFSSPDERGEDTASTRPASEDLFDLIHSTYALPFSADPQKVIADAAALLKPGGTFLLTTGHPLYAGEWLDIGDGEEGLFLPDYFRPEPDVRMSLDDKTMSAAHYWPISTIAEWIHAAGLVIERLLEPAPMPVPELSEAEIRAKIPYDSADWRALYPRLARIPVVVIFKCRIVIQQAML
jgi:SAM-dependent methyltransferase